MRFTKKLLLTRIKREHDSKLETFVVSQINKELKNIKEIDEFYDLVQMQYFFLEMYQNEGRREDLLRRLQILN